MIHNNLKTSYDKADFDDIVFDGDPLCDNDDNQSIMFDTDLYKSVKLVDNHYQISR